jgi:hypothetical protein
MAVFGRCAAVLTVLLLAACSNVTADINRTSSIDAQSKGKSFAVVPLSGQRGNAEFETYAERVRQRLTADGLVPARDAARADYAVFLRYGVTQGAALNAASQPLNQAMVRDPLSTRLDPGAIRGDIERPSSVSSITDSGGQSSPSARRLFDRTMEIDLVDTRRSTPDKLATVYSGKASTVGQHSELSLVGNCLIDAILDGFPAGGENQVTFKSETCEQ